MVFKKKKKEKEIEEEQEEEEDIGEEEEEETEIEQIKKRVVPQAPKQKEKFEVMRVVSASDPYKMEDGIVNNETEEVENLLQAVCSMKNELEKIKKAVV
jgi:hypothetical protein